MHHRAVSGDDVVAAVDDQRGDLGVDGGWRWTCRAALAGFGLRGGWGLGRASSLNDGLYFVLWRFLHMDSLLFKKTVVRARWCDFWGRGVGDLFGALVGVAQAARRMNLTMRAEVVAWVLAFSSSSRMSS